MDQILPAPNHELPKPQQNNTITDNGEFVVSAPETFNVAPSSERVAQAVSAVAQAATDDIPVLMTSPVSTPSVSDSTLSTTVAIPLSAADTNRIEKEWVTIAKFIVNKTKLDPRAQSSELSSFKHEYIKKRYGKEVKLSDDRVT